MHGLGFGSQGASALAFVFLVSGCMQSRVDESRGLQTQIQKNEAVVILAKPQVEGASAEDQFMHCVAAELTGQEMIDMPTDAWQQYFGMFLPDASTPFPRDQFPLQRALHGETVNGTLMFLRNSGKPR